MSEWISVKDRLPRLEEKVLIIDDNFIMYVGWLTDVNDMELQDLNAPQCWTFSDCCLCEVIGITHWQPLPDAPKD